MNKLLEKIHERFVKYQYLYPNTKWENILSCLQAHHLKALTYMEETAGEVALVKEMKDSYIFMDTAAQTPQRVHLCYDQKARENRKKFPPSSSVLEEAKKHQIEVLNEEEYRFLQTKFCVDTKTSSWILTPEKIRERNGALFCDRRYDTVFTYHNAADSYYATRGFRAKLVVAKK